MAPVHLTILGWVALAGCAWTAVEADRASSSLLIAIAAACGVVSVLLQALAISISTGRRLDAMLAAVRAAGRPANDETAP